MKSTTAFLGFVLLHISSSCVVQSTPMPGPQGEKGERGMNGTDGIPGDDLAALQAQIDQLEAKVAALSMQANPDCPAGYSKSPGSLPEFMKAAVVCVNGADEVVRVGSGSTAFWIDRYEASIWTSSDGPLTGTQRFTVQDDSDAILFPKTGQISVPYYALSVASVRPASRITWFQALETCAASGKRLPSRQEWLRAARGTSDPAGDNDGATNQRCNNQGSDVRQTANALSSLGETSCVSDWGAEDMIANLWELTDEWGAGLYDTPPGAEYLHFWPDPEQGSYNNDSVGNVSSYVACGQAGPTKGVPAVAMRGGGYTSGNLSGVFSLELSNCPSVFHSTIGFRCVVAR